MPELTEEERAELAVRSSQISFYQRTADLLMSERNLFLNHILTARGLDPTSEFQIDLKTGEITGELHRGRG